MVFHTMIQRQKLYSFHNEKQTVSLRKLKKIVPDWVKITGQQLQDSGRGAKKDVELKDIKV